MRGGVEVCSAVHGIPPLGTDDTDGRKMGLDERGGNGGWEDGVVD